jgi:hypothetical protein
MYSTVSCYIEYTCHDSNKNLTTVEFSRDSAMRSRDRLEILQYNLETVSRLSRDRLEIRRYNLETLSRSSRDSAI